SEHQVEPEFDGDGPRRIVVDFHAHDPDTLQQQQVEPQQLEVEELEVERRLVAELEAIVGQDQLRRLDPDHGEQGGGGGDDVQGVESKETAHHVTGSRSNRIDPLHVRGRHDIAADDEKEVHEQ